MVPSMEGFLLREATRSDAEQLVELIHASFEEYRGRLFPPSGAHNETAEGIQRNWDAAHAVLATVGARPVGCVFYKVEGDALHLSRLSVLPEHRCNGLGRALIAYVEARARDLGVRRVRLGVRVVLGPLRDWYSRLGYEQVEARTHEGFSEPTYVILEKPIEAV
jgi:ribosomal protein S18 acetylase RimI-like enzyme